MLSTALHHVAAPRLMHKTDDVLNRSRLLLLLARGVLGGEQDRLRPLRLMPLRHALLVRVRPMLLPPARRGRLATAGPQAGKLRPERQRVRARDHPFPVI